MKRALTKILIRNLR